MDLNTEVKFIKGIGPKRALGFLRLGIEKVSDLLLFFPVQYQDRTIIRPIASLFDFPESCIFGRVAGVFVKQLSMNLCILDAEIIDDSGKIYARFFRKKNPYAKFDPFFSIRKDFEVGNMVYIAGETKIDFGSSFISVSDYEVVPSAQSKPVNFNKVVPVYASTEGLSQKVIRDSVKTVLEIVKDYPDISDLLPQNNIFQNLKSYQAIEQIHFPQNLEQAELARRAFAAQEFIVLQTALAISRKDNSLAEKNRKYEIKRTLLTPFRKELNFDFTKAQKKSINEIFEDMQKPFAMNRMLMGDVGSGKTVVALSAILLAVENGFQTMIIAPTEILAQQHFATMSAILQKLGVKIALVTSSSMARKSERDILLSEIENGKIQVAVGTHSLIEDRIKFKSLSFVVIDEQHRFGVMQKFAALSKAQNPDILIMSATPIPRALAMTVYGEMDMSIIDELPAGRIPIKTRHTSEAEAYGFTIEQLKKGGQAYIVYPLIDESDKVSLKSAITAADDLSKSYFKDFSVGLIHGKMKYDEKSEIMQKFKSGEFQVLIATTVIEVGIDVPNATVMIIENSENYGLSALHQLRGRIGRGKKQSFCFLLGTPMNDHARQRIATMIKTNNGFEIAQEDLKMRGPGEFMGTQQHGFPEFKAGNIIKDADIIDFAKDFAAGVIDGDASLKKTEHKGLRQLVIEKFGGKLKLINVA